MRALQPTIGILLGIVLVLVASTASAQADFAGLPLKVGDRVYVTTPAGAEVGGRITQLSAFRLSIDGYDFTPEPGLKIDRRGDSLRNGALIGFAVGSAIGALLYSEYCAGRQGPCPPRAAVMLQAGVTDAAVGAFIDWLHVGRRPVFRADERR